MKKIKLAAIQMRCFKEKERNIDKAEKMIRESAENSANIILLPELFENPYFCQEKKYSHYTLAESLEQNTAVNRLKKLAKELKVVLPVSFYERDGNSLFNSTAVIDADGSIIGIYRKTHIPDDHFYQEKFYFTPGDTGFKVWNTRYGKIGIGICWDQWFPEAARAMALMGAEIILYPTAIGSEPILECDSMSHWRRCMQGHSASNIIPIAAANRIGKENVISCSENNHQESSLVFYGSSFITNETGEIISSASRDKEEIIYAEFDLDEIEKMRMSWGLFRDRRPECYKIISGKQ